MAVLVIALACRSCTSSASTGGTPSESHIAKGEPSSSPKASSSASTDAIATASTDPSASPEATASAGTSSADTSSSSNTGTGSTGTASTSTGGSAADSNAGSNSSTDSSSAGSSSSNDSTCTETYHPAVTHTETVVDQEAWDETVVDSSATTTQVQVGTTLVTICNNDGKEFTGPNQVYDCNMYISDVYDSEGGYHTEKRPVYETQTVPAVTHVVHHDAVTHTVTVVDKEAYTGC